MVTKEMRVQVSPSGKPFSTSSTSQEDKKTEVESKLKENVNNGSEIKKKIRFSEERKQNARGYKKSAKYVAKSERREDNYEYIMNGNINDKNQAREAFAKASKDEETVTEVDDKRVKKSKANRDVIFDKAPIEFPDVASTDDDGQFKAHKSEPPDTATQNPLRPNAEPTFKKVQQMIELFEATTLKENEVVENLRKKSDKLTDHDGLKKLPSPGQVLGH